MPTEIVFTSGGTESNNTAINAALQIDPRRQHIVTTAVEHSAVRKHCEDLAKRGCDVTFLGVDEDGNLDLAELESAIRPDTAIVSVMWANNETGVLFPVEEIAEIARRKGVCSFTPMRCRRSARFRCVWRIRRSAFSHSPPTNFMDRKASARSTSIGGRPFARLLFGGSQENARRAGTENVASIVALGKAAELAAAAMKDEQTRVRALRDRFEATLLANVPDTFVNGDCERRLPNTSNLSFAGIDADAALLMLDQQHLCCSAGSACRTGSLEASHVLRAMNLGEERNARQPALFLRPLQYGGRDRQSSSRLFRA